MAERPGSGAVGADSATLGFRAEIEGLRALAILLVVGAHAKVSWLAGGFVGVDVFFVLSGFLMTGLIVTEVEASGRFRFLDFYLRRLRRLLPALIVVFAASCLAAMALLSPLEQLDQVPSAQLVPLWLSNFAFAAVDLDYFGPQAEASLFLHTWSLGVEEQFYLVWPPLILLAVGAWAWQGGRRDRAAVGRVLMLVFVLSFAACVYLSESQARLAFYLMPFRAWQFALGGWVFVRFARHPSLPEAATGGPGRPMRNRWWWLAALGLAAILGSALVLGPGARYPGWLALLPTAGTALVLAAGAIGGSRSVPGPLLHAWSQQIGRVSYGWYLWHWPILVLGMTFPLFDNFHGPLLLSALALVLAFLSYRWVERPIRTSKAVANRRLASWLAALLLMVGGFEAVRQWQDAATAWSRSPAQLAIESVRHSDSVVYKHDCDDWHRSAALRPCVFTRGQTTRTVVFLGDSVGLQWFPAMVPGFVGTEWRIVVMTKSACPIVNARLYYARIGREYVECEQWRAKAVEWIQRESPEVVIVGSGAATPLSISQWREGSDSLLGSIAPFTGRIYLIAPTPVLTFDAVGCLARRAWRPAWLSHAEDCSDDLAEVAQTRVTAALEQASQGYDRVTLLRLDDLVCPGGKCRADLDGKAVFRDNQHVSFAFAASLAPKVLARMGLARAPAGAR